MVDKSPRKMTKSAAQNAVEYLCDTPLSNQCQKSTQKGEHFFSALFSLVFELRVKFPCC